MGNHASKTPERSARKSRSIPTASEDAIFQANHLARDFHAGTPLAAQTPQHLLHLQHTIGNQAVQRMLIQRAGGGRPDAGSPDAGRPDAGSPDAGRSDGGSPDAGRSDGGSTSDGGVAGGRAPVSLADAGNIDAFAHEAKTYWATNKKNTVEELYKHLVSKATSDLAALGVPAFKAVNYKTLGQTASLSGQFHSKTWELEINITSHVSAQTLTMSQITIAQVSEIASTVYHESRHAEQRFRMARVLAGDNVFPRFFESRLNIAPFIAVLAYKMPLKAGGDNQALFDEAGVWIDASDKYGTYAATVQEIRELVEGISPHFDAQNPKKTRWSNIKTDMTKIEDLLTSTLDRTLANITRQQSPDNEAVTIQKDIDAIKKAFAALKKLIDKKGALGLIEKALNKLVETLQKAYENFADEKDAFAVRDQVKQSVLTKP